MHYVLIACQALLAVVFVIAVVGKLRGPDEFVASIVALRLLPRAASRVAAYAVLGGEVVVVVALAVPYTVAVGLAGAAALLLALTTGIVVALRRGQSAPCRCFGASAAPLGRTHVVRNLVLAGLAGAGLAAGAMAGEGAMHLAGVVLALVAAGVGALIVVRLDDLVGLFGPADRRQAGAPLTPPRRAR
ncbi:MauE/DoxX family redox-associated membrane protein [Nonomuraea longicatena]|uniref:Methylamine utilization protein MauE n=1 Tax=Nonomuraea longicatena TaxID=83682 RepID=A0ABN1R833_9ACTN